VELKAYEVIPEKATCQDDFASLFSNFYEHNFVLKRKLTKTDHYHLSSYFMRCYISKQVKPGNMWINEYGFLDDMSSPNLVIPVYPDNTIDENDEVKACLPFSTQDPKPDSPFVDINETVKVCFKLNSIIEHTTFAIDALSTFGYHHAMFIITHDNGPVSK